MNVVAVIPCRYGSRRFPGKAIAPILGRPMVAWVVDAARRASRVQRVLVATDDERIAEAAQKAGAEVRMTSADHATGTDRAFEAVQGLEADLVLNLQGDEPLLSPQNIDRLVGVFDDPAVPMATLAIRGATQEERESPHHAKIVVDDFGNALYFSRSAIPFRNLAAGVPALEPGQRDRETWIHVGTYGFRIEALGEFVAQPRRGLEASEDLEQLRALSMGWRIRVLEVDEIPTCVDVPQDIARVERVLKSQREGSLR